MDVIPNKLREFGLKVSKYFLEFLETDFHRQQAPRRRIQLRNEANQTTGVPLRKYDTLYRVTIGLLTKEVSGTGMRVLNVPRGKYKAPINPILKNLIEQHVDTIEPEKFKAIGEKMLDVCARQTRAGGGRPREIYRGSHCGAGGGCRDPDYSSAARAYRQADQGKRLLRD